ncbi:MAG: hypothetical protein NTV34_05720, partial [Proteobacteria bacterium]|nr:hypothetical protein [Pseudomonadota bacterium]
SCKGDGSFSAGISGKSSDKKQPAAQPYPAAQHKPGEGSVNPSPDQPVVATGVKPINLVVVYSPITAGFLKTQNIDASETQRDKIQKTLDRLGKDYDFKDIWLTGGTTGVTSAHAFFKNKKLLFNYEFYPMFSLLWLAASICPAGQTKILRTETWSNQDGTPFGPNVASASICGKTITNSPKYVWFLSSKLTPSPNALNEQGDGALMAHLKPSLPLVILLPQVGPLFGIDGTHFLNLVKPHLEAKKITPHVIALHDAKSAQCEYSKKIATSPAPTLDQLTAASGGSLIDMCSDKWDSQVEDAVREAVK